MSELDQIVQEFLAESYEGLDQLERDLVSLEERPTDKPLLAAVFRCIHSIKGTCGFLGFTKLESVTHIGEDLLSKLRDGDLLLNAEITTGLLSTVDAVRAMLKCIGETGSDGEETYPRLIETLERLASGDPPPRKKVSAKSKKTKARSAGKSKAGEVGAMDSKTDPTPSEFPADEGTPADVGSQDNESALMGELLVERGVVRAEDVDQAVAIQDAGDPRRVGEILVEGGQMEPQDVLETLQVQDESRGSGGSDGSIRVGVELLDKLMNLVGELVLARNQILQFSTTQDDRVFLATSQRLNLIATELQEGVMKTRMQPIGNVWNKFPRVVRDLATATGKQVRIEMEGKDTELDKTIIEAIKDPLTHIIRNAVDHGIETPEQRTAAGKPAQGRLFLWAFHEGGQVNIEISDDGAGIDVDRIAKKAVERGLISSDRAEDMSDREAMSLVFQPGLSLAEKVSNVSGRGVGMDVVKTNIEKIGGTVDIQSKLGEGTTIKVKIPLTLAIIPGLIVKAGANRYVIPQVNLLELVRLEGEQARKSIEMVQEAPVYRLRGRLLPLVYLSRELRTENGVSSDDEDFLANIVVLQADERQFGLVVDDILDTEEIVVKPLSKQLKSIKAFTGMTVMGDGKVALILDVMGLAQRAKVLSEVTDRTHAEAGEGVDADSERSTLLIVGLGETGRLAIQQTKVARLEEIAADSVEYSGHESVVQYRDEIMPIIWLAREREYQSGNGRAEQPERLQVVVHMQEGRSVGLVVDRIVDIVEESITIDTEKATKYTFGSTVIHGRVTDLLDIDGVVAHYRATRKGGSSGSRIDEVFDAGAFDFSKVTPIVDIEDGNGDGPTLNVRIPLGKVAEATSVS